MDQATRAAILQSLPEVDGVVIFDEDTPAQAIDAIIPDLLTKGGDYKAEDIVGYKTVFEAGGQVEIIDLKAGYSTSALLR